MIAKDHYTMVQRKITSTMENIHETFLVDKEYLIMNLNISFHNIPGLEPIEYNGQDLAIKVIPSDVDPILLIKECHQYVIDQFAEMEIETTEIDVYNMFNIMNNNKYKLSSLYDELTTTDRELRKISK